MTDEQKREPLPVESGLNRSRQPPRPRVRRLWLPVGGTLVLALVAVALLWLGPASKDRGERPPTERSEVARLRSKLAGLEREKDNLERQLQTLDGGPARAPEARDPERQR